MNVSTLTLNNIFPVIHYSYDMYRSRILFRHLTIYYYTLIYNYYEKYMYTIYIYNIYSIVESKIKNMAIN